MPIYSPTDRSGAAAARERDQMLYELYTALDRIVTPSLPELIPFMRPLVEWRHCTIPEVAAIVNARIFPHKLVPDAPANDVTTMLDWNTLGLVMINTRTDADPNEPVSISIMLVGGRLVVEGGQVTLTSKKSFQVSSTPRRALDWLLSHQGMVMTREAIGLKTDRKLSDVAQEAGFKGELGQVLIESSVNGLRLKLPLSVDRRKWRSIAKSCQDFFDVEWRESSIAVG